MSKNVFFKILLIFFGSVVALQAQQLRTQYPEIRLSDKRVFAKARVESFDGISFCISHESGIEVAIPWELMPTDWKAAFPHDPDLKTRIVQTARDNEKKALPTPPLGSLKPHSARHATAAPAANPAATPKLTEAQLAYAAGAEERAHQQELDLSADHKKLVLGMSEKQCVKAVGAPRKVNATKSSSGWQEQWVYSGGLYLYLDNGILTTIQGSVPPPDAGPTPMKTSW